MPTASCCPVGRGCVSRASMEQGRGARSEPTAEATPWPLHPPPATGHVWACGRLPLPTDADQRPSCLQPPREPSQVTWPGWGTLGSRVRVGRAPACETGSSQAWTSPSAQGSLQKALSRLSLLTYKVGGQCPTLQRTTERSPGWPGACGPAPTPPGSFHLHTAGPRVPPSEGLSSALALKSP